MIWHAILTNTVDAPFSSITGSTTTGSTTPVPWFRRIELFCMLRHKSILKHGFKGFPCCLLMMLCLSLRPESPPPSNHHQGTPQRSAQCTTTHKRNHQHQRIIWCSVRTRGVDANRELILWLRFGSKLEKSENLFGR